MQIYQNMHMKPRAFPHTHSHTLTHTHTHTHTTRNTHTQQYKEPVLRTAHEWAAPAPAAHTFVKMLISYKNIQKHSKTFTKTFNTNRSNICLETEGCTQKRSLEKISNTYIHWQNQYTWKLGHFALGPNRLLPIIKLSQTFSLHEKASVWGRWHARGWFGAVCMLTKMAVCERTVFSVTPFLGGGISERKGGGEGV